MDSTKVLRDEYPMGEYECFVTLVENSDKYAGVTIHKLLKNAQNNTNQLPKLVVSKSVITESEEPQPLTQNKKVSKTQYRGLRKEYKTLKKLSECDNVINTLGFNKNEELSNGTFKHSLILEYMDSDLYDYNTSVDTHRLPMTQIKFLLQSILSGISTCHNMGIMHGDLKPDNILLKYKNYTKYKHNIRAISKCKLSDFGTAKELENGKASKVKKSKGFTPRYLAPESLKAAMISVGKYNFYGCDLSGRMGFESDIWAVGVIGFELLFRQYPFCESENENEMKESTECKVDENFNDDDIKIDDETFAEVLREELRQNDLLNSIRTMNWTITDWKDINSQSNVYKNSIAKYTREYNLLIDLLSGLLDANYKTRLTATQALSHPFFESKNEVENMGSSILSNKEESVRRRDESDDSVSENRGGKKSRRSIPMTNNEEKEEEESISTVLKNGKDERQKIKQDNGNTLATKQGTNKNVVKSGDNENDDDNYNKEKQLQWDNSPSLSRSSTSSMLSMSSMSSISSISSISGPGVFNGGKRKDNNKYGIERQNSGLTSNYGGHMVAHRSHGSHGSRHSRHGGRHNSKHSLSSQSSLHMQHVLYSSRKNIYGIEPKTSNNINNNNNNNNNNNKNTINNNGNRNELPLSKMSLSFSASFSESESHSNSNLHSSSLSNEFE